MESTLLFIFGSILFLMFLGMLYGDQLSMLGLFDGRLFTPVGSVFGRTWAIFTEAFERGIEFILAHLSWVVAAVSGAAGLLLIIFLMGGGLTADAAVYHADVMAPLNSGGVIDKMPQVPPPVVQEPIKLAEHVRDDSRLVFQVKSADYVIFGRPEFSRPWKPPVTDVAINDRVNRPITDRPFLDIQFRRLGSSVLLEEEIPEAVIRGRLVDTLPSAAFVRRAVNSLRNDNWSDRTLRRDDEVGLPQDVIPSATNADVRNFEALVAESRVRIIPGQMVSSQDLRVEKSAPVETETGEVELQIRIKNLGRETIRGLLVREMLPLETQVRAAMPDGILRDDTLIWLIDSIRPGEEQTLRLTAIPAVDSAIAGETFFESITEVSAMAAVTTSTDVLRDTPEPFPSDRRRRVREPAGAPDLRMAIVAPETRGRVGEWTSYSFEVTNRGDAAATDVVIRLILDPSLDQPDLLRNPRADHNVYARLSRVQPSETRSVRLEVRPREEGVASSTAELIYRDERLDSQRFRLPVGPEVSRR